MKMYVQKRKAQDLRVGDIIVFAYSTGRVGGMWEVLDTAEPLLGCDRGVRLRILWLEDTTSHDIGRTVTDNIGWDTEMPVVTGPSIWADQELEDPR